MNREEITKRLDEIERDNSRDDWDGQGACGVPAQTIARARQFAGTCLIDGTIARVAATPDGAISFERWREGVGDSDYLGDFEIGVEKCIAATKTERHECNCAYFDIGDGEEIARLFALGTKGRG